MAETGFRVEISGHQTVKSGIAATLERMEHPRELLEAIGLYQVGSTDLNFEKEQSPDGNPWPVSIRVKLEGGKTLTDSGHLRSTMTYEASDSEVAVGTNAIQAAMLHFGGTIKAKDGGALHFSIGGQEVTVASVKIPARPILGLSPADDIEIVGLAGDWLAEPLGGADENTRENADG